MNQDQPLGDLLYRGQYFAGAKPFPAESWLQQTLPDGMVLSTHPALEVTHGEENGFSVILLGFMLDPFNTTHSNAEIIARLSRENATITAWIEATATLGGRWIVFLYRGDEAIVFNDAGGMRTVFHHIDEQQQLWLGAQPGLFSKMFGFTPSAEAEAHMADPRYREKAEAWFPGNSSIYREVTLMQPNHLIDLNSKSVRRYWPTRKIRRYTKAEAVPALAQLLKGVVTAAHHRAPLALGLTSGVDSRAVLAACRDFAGELYIYTLLYRALTPDSDDPKVARQICDRLGLEHHLLDAREPMCSGFEELYREHTTGIKDDWCPLLFAKFSHIPAETLLMKGMASEIYRCRYWLSGDYPYRVDLRYLVEKARMGEDPLVWDKFRAWMQDALVVEDHGYKLLDIFSWENETGHWLAFGSNVSDLTHTEFTPLNCRRYIEIMLGTDPKLRIGKGCKLQAEVTRALWPELAEFPYTPSRAEAPVNRIKGSLRHWLQGINYWLFKEKHGRLEK